MTSQSKPSDGTHKEEEDLADQRTPGGVQLQTELTKEGLTMNSAETRAKDRREWKNVVCGLCPLHRADKGS